MTNSNSQQHRQWRCNSDRCDRDARCSSRVMADNNFKRRDCALCRP